MGRRGGRLWSNAADAGRSAGAWLRFPRTPGQGHLVGLQGRFGPGRHTRQVDAPNPPIRAIAERIRDALRVGTRGRRLRSEPPGAHDQHRQVGAVSGGGSDDEAARTALPGLPGARLAPATPGLDSTQQGPTQRCQASPVTFVLPPSSDSESATLWCGFWPTLEFRLSGSLDTLGEFCAPSGENSFGARARGGQLRGVYIEGRAKGIWKTGPK